MSRSAPEVAEAPVPLGDCLGRAIIAMWPRRAHQELLLDLGERKGWDADDRGEAIGAAAAWLIGELGLPPTVSMDGPLARAEHEGDGPVLDRARALGLTAKLGEPTAGVAAWVCGLAPALGSSAKTLANSLSRGLRSDRGDHRWLRVVTRVANGGGDRDAWCFHRRSPHSMGRAVRPLGAVERFDAGDALVVLSLLALWQRRRPTERVKGNRGRSRSRRTTPKPVAALLGGLAQPAQATALVMLARHLDPEAGRALSELAIEAALTEAHLAPHPTRSSASAGVPGTSGESWLRAAENAIEETGALLAEEDRAVLAFRIDRQRAWRARRPQSVEDDRLGRHPYVAACLALEQRIINPEAEAARFATGTTGLLMLLPALRSRGLLEKS